MTPLVAMLMPDRPMETEDFYGHVLPMGGGYSMLAYQFAGGSGMHHESFSDAQAMAARTEFLNARGATVYFAAGTFKNKHDAKRSDGKEWGRKGDNVEALGAFFLDIDVGAGKGYATTWDARQDLEKFYDAIGMPPNVVVESSGGEEGGDSTGLHVYWTLGRDLPTEEWLPIADRLKDVCRVLGLKADPARTADAASLLRPVGTTNRKAAYSPSGRPVRGQRVRFGQVDPERFDASLRLVLEGATVGVGDGLVGKPPPASSGKTLVTLGVVADFWFDRLDEPTKRATVSSMLYSLPDTDVETRESWIAVGAALAGTTGIDRDVLFEFWAEWSQRTPAGEAKWLADDIGANRRRFDGLDKSGVGALILRAQAAGWTQEAMREEGTGMFELVAAAREEAGARWSVQEARAYLEKHVVHVAADGVYLHRGVPVATESLNTTLAGTMPLQEGRPIAASRMFAHCKGVRVDYVGYKPGVGRTYEDSSGARFINNWREYVVAEQEPSDADRRVFAALIQHLAAGDKETAQGIQRICTKFAYLLKNPTKRIRHATLLIGTHEGSGKSTLTLEIPKALFGQRNVRVVETKELSSDFNGYANAAQILVFPELWIGNTKDSREQANNLKPLITDSVIPVVRKGKDGVMVDNCATIFANSNHSNAAVFSDSDRRYDVIETKAKGLPPEIAVPMYDLIENKPGALLKLVLAYGKGADSFDPAALPVATKAKRRMEEAGREVWVEIIRDAFDAVCGPFAGDAVCVKDVRRWLALSVDRLPSDNRIREELIKLADDATPMLAQKRIGSKRVNVRVIVLRNSQVWADAGPTALYEHYAGT